MDLVQWATDVAGTKLSDALPRRWAHVQGVGRRAGEAAALFGTGGELLVAAGLLHDVGYAPDLVDTGFHPIDGARFLRSVGAPERLVHLVAHHSCAVVEAELRGVSAELAEFEDEKSPLRDALWWADLTTTPDGGPTTIEQRAAEISERYGPEHVVPRFIRQAWPELLGAVERTEAALEASGSRLG
ncbi:HD domain-containing protein [Amycolatopsis cynarae]|uniref:HD domain-containing protein n=1 Tax=Amycolatopsis cynarae TaxID=2995223 RepID=A0ABY7AYY2_9PSEU|nr:HD domain-containing protein [Amycolatopsis sp. HUAS 11-8]WAL64919.1 HD domain-containing protein [Amycolatopsis sp. HUAS 11-8]